MSKITDTIATLNLTVGENTVQTLTNKTLTAPVLNGGILNAPGINSGVMANPFEVVDTGKPAIPQAGRLKHFAFSRAGRVLPHFVGPAGIDTPVQPALFGNSVFLWLPGTGATTSINFGCSWTARNVGTSAAQSHPTLVSTNALASLNRAIFSTGTTSTGSSGIQSTSPICWRGNASGLGGFFFFSRFAVETLATGMQFMVGLSALNAALAGEPSAQANSVALVKDLADSAWFLATRDATAVTKTPTGVTVTAGQILDLTLFAPPNGTSIFARLTDPVTNTIYVDNLEITANLPVVTTFLYAHAQCRSTSGTTSKSLALNRIYVETDL